MGFSHTLVLVKPCFIDGLVMVNLGFVSALFWLNLVLIIGFVGSSLIQVRSWFSPWFSSRFSHSLLLDLLWFPSLASDYFSTHFQS